MRTRLTPSQIAAAIRAAREAGAIQARVEADTVVIVMAPQQPAGNPADLVRMEE